MDNDVTVRAATVADARGIARVLVDGWQTTYAGILPADFLATFEYDQHEAGTRQHLENLPTSSAVFVAVHELAGVVGVAHVRESVDGPTGFSAELDALYVRLSMHGRRVGRRLFQNVVRWLQDRGQQSVFLWVLRDNPYRPFYDRLGGELLTAEAERLWWRHSRFGGVWVARPRCTHRQARSNVTVVLWSRFFWPGPSSGYTERKLL